ncbi:metallo-beta-lactamase domain-containing protein 1 [Phlebotomus argentipes]|uniref:metallo-beta-lactamase domain-containing protein 1 n=1 Tax=Phlebotomus argentipes TaxID=94469 RepID=UPI0028937809|nr:metallo-beta-lactamase domain-containing protein 1 [Phlebotomus argentipes]
MCNLENLYFLSPQHCRKARRHIVGNNISYRETYYLHDWKTPYVINEDVEIIRTPGHTPDCVSIIVKRSNLGAKVAITGDLFEKEEDIVDDSFWRDAGSYNEDVQRWNRAEVASTADVIIPGHGPAFAVTEEMRRELKRQVHNNSAESGEKL